MAFTQLTRQRAEELVRELTRTGEVNREQATAWVEDLLERSRQSTESLLGVIRKELDERIAQLTLVPGDDRANLAPRLPGVAPGRRDWKPRGGGPASGRGRASSEEPAKGSGK